MSDDELEDSGFQSRDRRRDSLRAAQNKKSLRSEETRITDRWTPPSSLPDPPPDEQWRYRWCRASTLARPDNANMSYRRREGWEPVHPNELPELASSLSFKNESTGDMIEVGGLVLCKMPRQMADQRAAYYDQKAKAQIGAVDTRLRELGDKVKFSINRKSRVSNSPFE